MSRRFVLVTHDADERDDRASAWLRRHGQPLEWVCPAVGEALPVLGEDVAGIIVYGGRYDVDQQEAYPFLTDEMAFIDAALGRETPVLGLCLGAQLMAHVLGAKVHRHPEGAAEYGYYRLDAAPGAGDDIPHGLSVLQSHWHGWFDTPAGASLLARSELYPQQAFRYGRSAYALQFHPEATGETMRRWIGRRPAQRHALPGAHLPERQIADHALYDEALAQWFEAFMARWAGPAASEWAAAE
jgi:GMP synthase (glutamine-hydrolysing)